MKILIVCGEYFNTGNGLSLSTQRFVEQFLWLGDEVRVLSSDHGGKSEYSVPVMRVPLVDRIMNQQYYHFARPVASTIREALSWAEIVHIEDPFPLSVKAAKMAAKMRLPITGTFHLYPENMTASVPVFDFPLNDIGLGLPGALFQSGSAIPFVKLAEGGEGHIHVRGVLL